MYIYNFKGLQNSVLLYTTWCKLINNYLIFINTYINTPTYDASQLDYMCFIPISCYNPT